MRATLLDEMNARFDIPIQARLELAVHNWSIIAYVDEYADDLFEYFNERYDELLVDVAHGRL